MWRSYYQRGSTRELQTFAVTNSSVLAATLAIFRPLLPLLLAAVHCSPPPEVPYQQYTPRFPLLQKNIGPEFTGVY